jgi:hypothetical protein
MVVQQTKRMAQAGMLQTRLHANMWEESVNYGWHCHNLYPLTRNVSPADWLQEQQQGENRVKSMLFHMSGEGALLTTCSKRCSPPGANVPGGWICRHRAQPNSSHIPPPHGHLGAAVAFGRGPLAGKHYQPPQLALDFCCC